MTSTNGHGPKRAILYARVSTDEQARSGYSLAQQIEALREYAACEGYEVLEEITDPGQSGASLERPGMDRVRDLVVAGGVSVVLAQDRDRFAREPAYHYLLRKEFEEYCCKIRALNDRGDDSPEGSSPMESSISLRSSSAPRPQSEHGGEGSGKRERVRS
jgi:site-specific DNA recombinase